MKLFYIATFIFGIILTTILHTEGGVIDPFVKKFFNDLIANMGQNNSKLHLPALDPLELTNINVSLSLQEGVDLDLYLQELKVTGLKTIVIDRVGGTLDFTPTVLTLAARLFVPRLSASAHYEIGLGDSFTLDGTNAPLSLTVGDISVIANIEIIQGQGNDTDHLYVTAVKPKLDLGWVHVDVGNVLDDKALAEVVNALIDDLVPQLLKIKEQDIYDFVQSGLKSLLDGQLKLSDLMS